VHFSTHDIWATLANFRRSGSRCLLTTTFVARDSNASIRTGSWQPLRTGRRHFRHFRRPLPTDTSVSCFRLVTSTARFLHAGLTAVEWRVMDLGPLIRL
jgi:hypothetical protein